MSINRLRFIEPNAPLPSVAASKFLEKFENKISESIADFRGIVAFLPTRSAAKTLRDTIVAKLLKRGVKNVLGLNLCTYEDYLARFSSSQITKLENYSIWLSILLNCDFKLINALLPSPENISRREVLYIAKEIIFLQQKFYDDLISIKDASEKFKDSPDSKRWQDLSFLEDLYNYKLKDLSKITELENNLKSIEKASNSKIDTVLIIANPDISASLKLFVEKFEARGKELEIFVFAKEEDKWLFDDFGAAKELEYSNREISLKQEDIFPCLNVEDEANLVYSLMESYGDIASKSIAIACEQKESALVFEEKLSSEKLKVVALENNKLSKTSLFNLLKNIKEFLEDKSFEAFRNLCLNSYVIDYVESNGVGLSELLREVDLIKNDSACKDIGTVKALAKEEVLLDMIAFFESININNLEEKILKLCANAEDGAELEALELFQDGLDSIFSINEAFYLSFNLDEVFTILFETLEGATLKTKIEKDSIVLQDWMEIFWSKAPHLLLCDMNDGIVPLRENNGLFLNDSIRKTLSMRTQKIRQARDAYMLDVLATSRAKASYGISVLLPQRNTKEESLIASRLLFQCKKENIAKRVKLLFKEISPKNADVSNELDWNLCLEKKEFVGNFSVSRFNSYLNSPWLFYLQNVLNMNIVDCNKEELSFADFGNIYHSILEKFGKSKLKNSKELNEINTFFLKTLDEILKNKFANNPRAQVKIQLQDLKSRLYYTAKEQVEHRKQGWEILYVEEKFKNYKLSDGVLLNGVFDRIDYHKDEGYLIIDYKTKDKADKNIVEDSHRKLKRKGDAIWYNLQMPIYLEVFENLPLKIDKNASLNCAYFCATKDSASTKIRLWDNAKDYVDEAKNIAIDIAEKIKQGQFFDFESEDKYKNFNSVFRLDFDLLKNNVIKP